MTDAEERFQAHLTSTANYHAEVVARGGTLWWLDAVKLTNLERHIPGISQMPPEERRRALFTRHHREATPA
jgi:hypothetical protein